MDLPKMVSRDEWRAARLALLAREKEHTRVGDALAAERRALPMVEVDKEYAFASPAGKAGLGDLFEGRRQLIVYHFMWLDGPDEGCPSCSFLVDGIGDRTHLERADTTLALVSRAPVDSIERFRTRMGWTIPWYSSAGGDFNYDFHATNDPAVAPVEYNFMDADELERKGVGFWAHQDGPGVSVFVRDGERIFHTYSTYGRGAEPLLVTYGLLDMTPLGRQRHIGQTPHKDRYGEPAAAHHH